MWTICLKGVRTPVPPLAPDIMPIMALPPIRSTRMADHGDPGT